MVPYRPKGTSSQVTSSAAILERYGVKERVDSIRRTPSRTTSSSSETPSRTEPSSATTVNTARTFPTGAPSPTMLETHRSLGKVRPYRRTDPQVSIIAPGPGAPPPASCSPGCSSSTNASPTAS
jgi:hypothetical protein